MRLVIRPGAIGDCILAMPAIQVLEPDELWVSRAVVRLCTSLATVVRPLASTGIDLVGVGDLELPTGFAEHLRAFDSVVSWYGTNRLEFRQAIDKIGVPCQFHAALPPPDYSGHATDFFLQQVGARRGALPQIIVHPTAKRDGIVIHPFSGGPSKNWPLDRYRQLASCLPRAVEWSAGPEEELPEAVRFDDLYQLAQWIGGAQLYIGNDSGITHLAAATGVPTLALFGSTRPETWAPRGENVKVVRGEPMEQISVDLVLDAANRLLGSP